MRSLWAFTLIALASATPVSARDWWFVGAVPDTVLIVDADSISARGPLRTVVDRVFPRPREGYAIVSSLVEVDCERRRHRYLRPARFDSGEAVDDDFELPEEFTDWQSSPNANSTAMIGFVCASQDARPAGAARIGNLALNDGDRSMLFRLLDAGVPPDLAAPLALGRLPRSRAEALIAAAPAEIAQLLRSNGFPR